ncbi:VOC family protein [Nonomuraea dietziae]|uniref:Putative 3-demethylubiquinone-9 3-methyltransferase (Glyoxalase superfamily) n=1 Tax=Nonomuraea dietziae TaxID=65515 RepID=A0A7W5VFX4_9ACTN|nr:VOC family protein [Nonomuraea dietziae]MBB3730894.1 putative 3-demethylubiquinone-9 3-methyltransferase (glyoxalase superfamily) [Nonomuraea dietziae]
MQKITTYLWFDNQAEEAANHYVSIFPNSRVVEVTPMIVTFEIEGQRFIALNGGPQFTFTEAISLYVDCDTQEEVDELWAKLVEGGQESQCGWLKDKYGLSWQIIPKALPKLLSDPDPARAERAMQAMLKMSKINVKELEEAANG